jgi:hypothetical protein
VAFNDFLANSQADTGTTVFIPGVEPVKHREEFAEVLWLNPDSVVPYLYLNLAWIGLLGLYHNSWGYSFPAIFNPVSNEILQHLTYLDRIRLHFR